VHPKESLILQSSDAQYLELTFGESKAVILRSISLFSPQFANAAD
jgi:hypothetical protein